MSKPVVDVSTWQKIIDYKKMAPAIQGAIIRAGFTGSSTKSLHEDELFFRHYDGFYRANVPVGVYWYSRAVNTAEGRAEAEFVLNMIRPLSLLLPVFIDVEDMTYQDRATKTALTDAVTAFCLTIEQAGYYVGIYASSSWFRTKFDLKRIERFDKWVAHYHVDKPNVPADFKYGLHQYTSSGSLPGYTGMIDLNHVFKDYPFIIQKAGLNGWPKGDKIPEPTPIELAAMQLNLADEHMAKAMDHLENARYLMGWKGVEEE